MYRPLGVGGCRESTASEHHGAETALKRAVAPAAADTEGMATPRIGGSGEPAWMAGYGVGGAGSSSAEGGAVTTSAAPAAFAATISPQALDENGALQLQLSQTEEMLLLIGELEEQLQLERRRADILERKAAFAVGVLPPDTSASPRELQKQRDELLEFIGEMEEAGMFQCSTHTDQTPVSRAGSHSAPAPPVDSATKHTQLLSDADAWLMQSAQLAGSTPRASSVAGSPAPELALPLQNLVRGAPTGNTPARRLMEEARVLRKMIAAHNSPLPHTMSGLGSCGGSNRKKKSLAQRAPLQRLSSNSAHTPRLHATGPPPIPSPMAMNRTVPTVLGCQTARSCAASALGVDVSAISDRIVLFFVSKLQAWARMVLAQRRYKRQRRAAITIQCHTRGAAGREHAERLRQAELATFLTPFKTLSDDTDTPGYEVLSSPHENPGAEADHSLTAEEEAEWDQWLERAKAAEEEAKSQHQHKQQRQQQMDEQRQQQMQQQMQQQQQPIAFDTIDKTHNDAPSDLEVSGLIESEDV